MMITCPRCQSRYRVAGQDFLPTTPRKVRCAACQHVWVYAQEAQAPQPRHSIAPLVTPPTQKESTPSSPTAAIPLPPKPQGRRTWSLWVGWILWCGMVAALVVGYGHYKSELTALWPPLTRIEALLNPSRDLKALQILELGHHVRLSPEGRQMVITGVIENTASHPCNLPQLFMRLEGPHTPPSPPQPVPLPQESIAPEERIFFECPGVPIPPQGTKVRLTF